MATENVSAESGEAGGEVTYVGGKAVEQSTEGETHEGTDHGDELAAAKAAVKAALEEEGKKAAKEAKEHLDKDPLQKVRDKDGKFKSELGPAEQEVEDAKKALAKELKKAEPKPKDDADEDASALKKALQERKEAAKLKAEAAAELEKSRQEVRQVYQQLQRQQAELAAEKQRLELLRKDPIRAIKENGWDPEEFILDIAADGTPEGQAKRAQRELMMRLERAEAWQKQQAQLAEQAKVEAKQREQQERRQQVERQFLQTAAQRLPDGSHKNKYLVSMYKDDPDDLIIQADLVAEKYRKVSGKEASFAEIAEYLEERAMKWYKSMSSGTPQVGAPVTAGKPTQGSATGRSLSPNGSSERRSLGASLRDLDGDERREAAMDAVRAALHASGER